MTTASLLLRSLLGLGLLLGTVRPVEVATCDLFVRPHPTITEVGVFAGRAFAKGETVEQIAALELPDRYASFNILDFYAVQGDAEAGSSLLALGYAAVYNHHSNRFNLDIVEPAEPRRSPRIAHPAMVDLAMVANRNISEGEEKLSDVWRRAVVRRAPPADGERRRGQRYSHGCRSVASSARSSASASAGLFRRLHEVVGGKVFARRGRSSRWRGRCGPPRSWRQTGRWRASRGTGGTPRSRWEVATAASTMAAAAAAAAAAAGLQR
jgi:hypothetical protein